MSFLDNIFGKKPNSGSAASREVPKIVIAKDSPVALMTAKVASDYLKAGIEVKEVMRKVNNAAGSAEILILIKVDSELCPVMVSTSKWDTENIKKLKDWCFIVRHEKEFSGSKIYCASAYDLPQEVAELLEKRLILNYDGFAATARQKLEEMYKDSKVEITINKEVSEKPCLKITYKGGPHFFGLGNAYKKYVDSPSTLTEILEQHFKGLKEADALDMKDFEGMKDRILPFVKPREFLKNKKDELYLYSDFVGGLIKVYVINLEDSIMYINKEMCADWGKTQSQIDKIAVSNLENMPEKELIIYGAQAKKNNKTVYCNINGKEFLASLLLCPKKLLNVAAKYGGLNEDKIIVAVPGREEMALYSANFGLNQIRAMAKESYDKAIYPVTDKLFEIDNKGNLKEKSEVEK